MRLEFASQDTNTLAMKPDTALRLFGKPRVEGQRRVAVTLARGADVDEARAKARRSAAALSVALQPFS